MSHLILGLDIGTYSIKAAVLDPKDKNASCIFDEERVIVHAALKHTQEESPPEQEQEQDENEETSDAHLEVAPHKEEPWIEALQRLMKRMDAQADAIVSFLPFGQAMTVRIPKLPFATKDKVVQILPGLLINKLPMDPSEVVTDFIIDTHEDEHTATVGFARQEDVAAHLDLLHTTHIDPIVLGVPELMLKYAIDQLLEPNAQGCHALLDIGHETTRVIVVRDGQVLQARSIRTGGAHITRALAQSFKIDETQAELLKHQRGAILLAHETQDPGLAAMSESIKASLDPMIRDLRRSFQSLYARDRVQLDMVYVCGGSSQIKNLKRHLSDNLGVEVKPLPLEAKSLPGTHYVLAYGLAAQHRDDRHKLRMVDLRQEQMAYRGKSSYLRAQLTKLGVAAGVLLVLLLIAMWMQKRDLDTQRDAMKAAVTRESKKMFGAAVYSAKDVKKRINAEEDSATSSVASIIGSFELMHELITHVDANTQLLLKRLEVDTGRKIIQIYGITSTPQAVDKIVSELEQYECLRNIKKDKLQVKKENEVTFELQAKPNCT